MDGDTGEHDSNGEETTAGLSSELLVGLRDDGETPTDILWSMVVDTVGVSEFLRDDNELAGWATESRRLASFRLEVWKKNKKPNSSIFAWNLYKTN